MGVALAPGVRIDLDEIGDLVAAGAPEAALDRCRGELLESFFATLKKELVNRRSWPTRRELMSEVFEYIEAFYNRTRRHSTLGYLSPLDYENRTLSEDGAGARRFAARIPQQEIK
jgi:Integrase core domain